MGCSESHEQLQCPVSTFKSRRPTRSIDWWESRLRADDVTTSNKGFPAEDSHSPLTKEQKKLVRESWRLMAPRATEIGKQVKYEFAISTICLLLEFINKKLG